MEEEEEEEEEEIQRLVRARSQLSDLHAMFSVFRRFASRSWLSRLRTLSSSSSLSPSPPTSSSSAQGLPDNGRHIHSSTRPRLADRVQHLNPRWQMLLAAPSSALGSKPFEVKASYYMASNGNGNSGPTSARSLSR